MLRNVRIALATLLYNFANALYHLPAYEGAEGVSEDGAAAAASPMALALEILG